jgi:hypothetical protein
MKDEIVKSGEDITGMPAYVVDYLMRMYAASEPPLYAGTLLRKIKDGDLDSDWFKNHYLGVGESESIKEEVVDEYDLGQIEERKLDSYNLAYGPTNVKQEERDS